MNPFLVQRRAKRAEEMSIAPLIDMVFILLIFFMVSTTFVRDLQLELERPGASSAEVADTRALRVQVDRRGGLYVDGQSVRPWMLEPRVRQLMQHQRFKTVLVVADQSLRTGDLIEVVDQCRMAGAEHVGLSVEQE
ncbi:MAG: biopolymer transporter ExbD [Proteobacteria bacterium]|jgi:biopolymer transport protein ExbD|nr:biopolymer transporter ExbD [Pseudomonadota bacterium]